MKLTYATFRLACHLLHYCFDGDICTTAQARLAVEGQGSPTSKQHLAHPSITPHFTQWQMAES